MRAAIFHGPGKPVTIETMNDPAPSADGIVVRVHRCGICGSDISLTGEGPVNLPVGRFGHEWAGEIVEVGSKVTHLRRGQHIAALPKGPCGSCEGCRSRNPLFCERTGYVVGGFGEYVGLPASAAVPLAQTLSLTDGALVEPMSCGLHALRLARMEKGARVLVIGAGSMALSLIYWARNLGAGKIAVLSRSGHRNDVVMAMGADAILGFDEDDQRRIVEVLGGAPEIVAEGVGKEGMLALAAQHVRPQGTILSLGQCQHAEPVIPGFMSHKEVRLIFPRGYTVEEFEHTARSFDAGRLDPDIMVSETIALDDFPRVLHQLQTGARKGLKVHVDPFREAPAL